MVSHYKMGARSWSDRWTRASSQQVSQTGQQQQHHHHHSHPSPQHHHQYHHPHQQQHHNNHLDHNNTSTTTAYVQPHDDRLSHEVALFRERQIRLQSVQTDLELALPPSISLPDGEEYPYDSLQHLHLRNAEQESEILRECIRPPPNRTIFEGESPPPYRACSMGTLHSSSSSSSTFSLMSGSANNGALRVRSADYSAPLVMRCHSMCSNNCNCGGSGHHHSSSSSSSGSGGSTSSSSSNSSSSSSSSSGSVAGGGRGTTPLSHHLRIARLVNSRPSNAASSTSLPASSSVTSTFSSSSCSFCDPPTAASSSSVNYNHNGHGNRCPNGAITTSTNRCCRLNVTKTEQRPGTTGLNGGLSSSSSSGSSNSGGGGGVSSSHAMTTAAVSASSAGVGHTRVTDNLNGSRHHPVTLTLTEGSRDVEEDRNRNCSGGNAGSGHGGGGGNNATGGNAGV